MLKIFDSKIAEKWRSELLGIEDPPDGVSTQIVDWIINELRCKAKIFHNTGAATDYNADVIKSDSAVSVDIKEALKTAVKVLKNIPVYTKTTTLDRMRKVADLVHPSLFPLVYGRTRVL